MKRIIKWFKNDLFYYRVITYQDTGFMETKLYMNRRAALSAIAVVFIFGALIVWKTF